MSMPLLQSAAKTIDATYDVPIIAHAPMEPLNAIAHVQADRVDVWVGTQNADAALTLAAQASGQKPENVYIHNTFSGGGFGRRLGPDEVAQAVAVSKAVGKPVKLVWTREEEIRQGRYRTQAAIRFKAGFAADGTPVALDMRNSAGSGNPAAVKDGLDAQTMQGLINTAYKLPNFRVISILKNTHVPLGPWRAPGHSQNVFFIESFVDEMAYAAGKDPVVFRRELLAHRPDFQQVIDLLVEKSDWGKPMPPGKGRGVAVHESYESIVGMVAEVTVTNGQVKVDRVVIACDCGTVVNPRGVETQLEGGMIYGLSAALFGEITVKDGRVVEGNFDTYPGGAPQGRAEDGSLHLADTRQTMGRCWRARCDHDPAGGDQCDLRRNGTAPALAPRPRSGFKRKRVGKRSALDISHVMAWLAPAITYACHSAAKGISRAARPRSRRRRSSSFPSSHRMRALLHRRRPPAPRSARAA